ncbi:fatty acid-binding protein, heart-like [Saccostrea echinata]|uniref:fatty acid-binding protein, heart-like n=1 Tax=Saccostrea echinata TaxID=191078 RepID=UPI002A8268E2|nr:fatty acid-binding protein, heart-like [Saccostrea echinata]
MISETFDLLVLIHNWSNMALAEIEKTIAGVWILDRNENLDEYLKEIGVNFVLRKLAAAANSTMTITVEDEQVRIHTKGPKDSDHNFSLDTEVESSDPQDNPMKATVTWEDGKLITEAKPTEGSKGKATRVERELVNGELIMTVYVNNVVCRRIFKKK